jgi:hypothetical protein
MTAQPKTVELARVRAEFERWRAERAGWGRIPDRLWRAAVSLLQTHAPSTVCRELRLSATDLKKRRQALAATPNAARVTPPPFVELRAVDLTTPVTRSASDQGPGEAPVRLELTRSDGARLTLDVPSTYWARVEALCAAFLAG